jgi:hypothetical protein
MILYYFLEKGIHRYQTCVSQDIALARSRVRSFKYR